MNLSPSLAPVLTGTVLPPGDGFYPALAEAIVGQGVAHGLVGDLSSLRVLLPALPMAAELRPALARAAGRPMLLPQFSTFSLWAAQTVDPSGLPAPLAASERLVLLHEALRGLSEAQQQLLGLAYFRGLSHSEIAAHTGLPLGTVKTHIRRGLQALARAMPDPDGSPE